MTAAILFSINPWLALVTLLPLPFIAWMIHVVRDRLRTGFEKIDRVWARDDQRAGRHHSRHPRGQGLRPGEARGGALPRGQPATTSQANDRVNKIWSFFSPTVTLLTEIGLLVVWAFGVWQVVAQQHHGRRADRLPRLHQPLLHAGSIR